MFSQADITNAMQTLELPQQVEAIESLVAELGIAACADVIALHLLSIMLDLDGGEYPPDVVQRAKRLVEQMRAFNEARFGAESSEGK